MSLYSISFENGCSLFINAPSISDAAKDGIESLVSCMPKDFVRENMVSPTIIRLRGDFCKICGRTLRPEITITVKRGVDRAGGMFCVSCARNVAEAYEGGK